MALLKAAAAKQHLTFGLSTHRGENYYFFNGGMKFPSDVRDTTLSIYGTRSPDSARAPDAKFLNEWITHLYELVNDYQPSMIFFDGTPADAFFKPLFLQFLAHYYNSALDWKEEVGVNYKIGLPSDLAIYDVERGKLKGLRRNPWQSDNSVGKKSWSYIEGEEYKTSRQLVIDLVDIVSKNGNYLLNIGPKADGTIPEEVKQILLDIGQWLKINGEGIYETRPWVKFGEGPTQLPAGSHTDRDAIQYTIEDIRYTTKGSDLYATCLAWADGNVLLTALDKANVKNIRINDVAMLGSKEKLVWKLTDKGLQISFPKAKPCNDAYTFKIKLEGQVISDVEPYFVERDPLPPGTADVYVYNHSKVKNVCVVKVFADDKLVENKSLVLAAGVGARVEVKIGGLSKEVKYRVVLE